MTEEEFYGFARELAAMNGLPLEQAEEWAVLIGDTPELVSDGDFVVRDANGKVIGERVVVRNKDGIELGRVIVLTDSGAEEAED